MATSPDRRQNHDNFFPACQYASNRFWLYVAPCSNKSTRMKTTNRRHRTFSLFKLSGFGVQDPRENPIQWDVSFETNGDDYLEVLIRFMGKSAMPPEVDIC